jgi:hypothetical protein
MVVFIDTIPLYLTTFRENSFKTIYDFFSSPGSIFLMRSGFNNTNPLSLETQKKKKKQKNNQNMQSPSPLHTVLYEQW